MKSIFVIAIVILNFSLGYAGEADVSDESVAVNQIGKWKVTTTISGDACEGKVSEMIQTIQAKKGDAGKIGLISYKGVFFKYGENGTCRLIPVSGTEKLDREALLTEKEFRKYEWNDMKNHDRIKRFEITKYTDRNITIELEYTDGSILRQTFSRL